MPSPVLLGGSLRLPAVCLLLLSGPSLFAARADAVPDWVRSARAQAVPSLPADTDAVVLLDDTTYTVAPGGAAVEHRRRVVKILRPQGREQAMVYVPFDADSKLLNLHIWSVGPDGHEYALKDNEISEIGYPGQGNLFEDLHIKVANAPGRDPGGIVAYEYNQRARPYLTEATWFFQSDLPQLNESFTLELPPGFSYGAVWAHNNGSQGIELEHQRWRWEMHNTPAIELRHIAMRPAEDALTGRMTVHYSGPGLPLSTEGSWKSIGEWYATLSRDRLVASPELAGKARELAAGHTDFADKTKAIAEWVQNEIRYFAIERGIGGEQPHFAADIYRNRYGDCKDKATLLTAMLSAVDVHAALMMVDSRRGVIDPDAPSTVGNHMITAIQLPQGYSSPLLHSVITAKTGRKYLIFDPTWDKTAFGQLAHNLQGSYGVLMEGSDSQIVPLPVMDPGLNTIRRSAHFKLDADGSLRGTVIEKRFGDVSERRRELYVAGDSKQQTDFLDHVLGVDFLQFNVANLKVENAASLTKDLTMSYALEVNRFARPMGQLLMLRPRVLGQEELEPDRKDRHVPVDLRETLQATDDFEIELPAGYAVDEIPDPVKVDMGFAAYESASHVQEHTLHYRRVYTVRQVSLPAERYTDVQRSRRCHQRR